MTSRQEYPYPISRRGDQERKSSEETTTQEPSVREKLLERTDNPAIRKLIEQTIKK
jgi:hypothetical protein